MVLRGAGPLRAGAVPLRRIAGLAEAENLPFAASRPHGSTFDAHRLPHFAHDRGCQQAVLAAAYRAHFGGERSIFDAGALAAIAADAGLDPDAARSILAGDAHGEDVRADERHARELGITGVPYFVADGRLAVPGCQPTGLRDPISCTCRTLVQKHLQKLCAYRRL